MRYSDSEWLYYTKYRLRHTTLCIHFWWYCHKFSDHWTPNFIYCSDDSNDAMHQKLIKRVVSCFQTLSSQRKQSLRVYTVQINDILQSIIVYDLCRMKYQWFKIRKSGYKGPMTPKILYITEKEHRPNSNFSRVHQNWQAVLWLTVLGRPFWIDKNMMISLAYMH